MSAKRLGRAPRYSSVPVVTEPGNKFKHSSGKTALQFSNHREKANVVSQCNPIYITFSDSCNVLLVLEVSVTKP